MGNTKHVIIKNNCKEDIKVYLRIPKAKKKVKIESPQVIKPEDSSAPFPLNFLIGAKGWDILRKRKCVEIISIIYVSHYCRLENRTKGTIDFTLKIPTKDRKKKSKTLRIRPGKKSRAVDIRTVSQRKKLKKLKKEGKIKLESETDIGPAVSKGRSVASFAGEGVYICYKCGGLIVFRGDPPTPIHI